MPTMKSAGIWVYKKIRGPVRGALTATGIIELTALGIAKGALIGGILKGLAGIIIGGVLGFGLACALGIGLKALSDKLDAAIAAEDKEFELQIIEEEKNNLDNEISLRAKLKALREQWAGESKNNERHGFSYKVTKLSNKVSNAFALKIKQIAIKISPQVLHALQQKIRPKNVEENVIRFGEGEPIILRSATSTPREERPTAVPAPDSSSVASTTFTVTKILASAGTILTVAFYAASIGAMVCAPIPVVGVPLGYVLGALGGVVLGAVFVYAFGESVSKLKEMTENKKYQQDPEWKAELKSFQKEISNTQKSLLELKETLQTQGDIIREGMGKPLTSIDQPSNSAKSGPYYVSLDNRKDSNETQPLLAETTITHAENQNKAAVENQQSDLTENKSPQGFLGWTWHYLYRFGHFIVLTVGGITAVSTIATCTFYGALMGFKIGLPIPLIGPIGVCIIGGIVGFTIGLIGAYLGVKSCVSVVQDLTDNDQKTCVNDELYHIIDELDKTHDQLISLEKELDAQLELLESHTPRTTPRGAINTKNDDYDKIEINDAELKSASKALPIISSAPAIKKIVDGAKSRTKTAWQTTKSIFFKCVCGAAGLALIGLCAYQGVMLGLALGTVIPGFGNIIGAVTGGLIGAVCGVVLAHSAAQGIKKIDRIINGENIAETVAIVNDKTADNKAIMQRIKEKQKKIDTEAFPAAFDEKNKDVWGNRGDLKYEADQRKSSNKVPKLERKEGSKASWQGTSNSTEKEKERIDKLDSQLLPPPAATVSGSVTQFTESNSRKTSESASSSVAPSSAFFVPTDSAAGSSIGSSTSKAKPPTKPPPLPPTASAAIKSSSVVATLPATTLPPTTSSADAISQARP